MINNTGRTIKENNRKTESMVNSAKIKKNMDSFCRRSYSIIHQKAAISTYNIKSVYMKVLKEGESKYGVVALFFY